MTVKKDSRGFTMVEMVVVLGVIAILVAILTPVITGFVDRARVSAARSDLQNIATAITSFNTDAKFWPIYETTPSNPNDTDNVYTTIFSDGIEPTVSGGTAGAGWSTAVTASSASMASVMNDPAKYTLTGSQKHRGPYLEFGVDPWGSKYYLTALHLMPNSANVAYVISAGPDQTINTDFTITKASVASSSLVAAGDDILVRLR